MRASNTSAMSTPVTTRRRIFGFTVPSLRPGYRWGMPSLAVYAIGIDDVRDIFGADDTLAERLRAVAAARFATDPPVRRTWFKPLRRRDPGTEVSPDRPLRGDMEALLAGGYIAPDRLPQCWALFTIWLEELSLAHLELPWEPESFDRAEWDLAAAGLNSDFSLRRLAERQLGVPLRPLEGQVVGYAKALHVAETADALAAALTDPELPEPTHALAAPLLDLLREAAGAGLGVVVVGR